MNMELLYVWISENETGFIKNQGFHFSPVYKFEMKYLKDARAYKLDCITDEDYPNVWKRNNLCGLTAVVGENGTGKTSLMKTLLTPNNKDTKLMVYKVGDELFVFNQLRQKVQYWSDRVHENDPSGVRQIPMYMTNAYGGRFNDLQGNAAVFSPNSDIRYHFTEGYQSLIQERSALDNFALYQDDVELDFAKLAVVNYYHHQFVRTNSKKDNVHESLLNVNSTLTIGIRRSFENIFTKLWNGKWIDPSSQFRTYAKSLRKRFRNSSSLVERLWLILCIELFYIVGESYMDGHWGILSAEPKACVLELLRLNMYDRLFSEKLRVYYMSAVEEVISLEDIFSKMGNLDPVASDDESNASGMVLSFEKNPEEYIAFCAYISKLLRKTDSFLLKNLSIDMSELSSGEMAMQNICAWLIVASNSVLIDKISKGNNILLLLDEVDLYMHPEWQRKFLNFLMHELDHQFSGYQIQIVITTHSPLVLSDVPSGNIIYLGRKKNHCAIDGGPESKETFGANIFTLLKDSFYLERSLGEFAYSRIREVIVDLQMLKDWDKSDPDKEQPDQENKLDYNQLREKCREHKRLIGIIGEPMVRGKLQSLYSELFSEGADTRFEKQLSDIRTMLKVMDPDERRRRMAELDRVLATMKEQQD